MINKKKKSKKNNFIILIFIIILFILTSIFFLTSNSLFSIQKPFKNIMSYVNTNIINKIYHDGKIDENVITSKIKYLEKENNELKKIIELNKTNTNYVAAEVINKNFSDINNKVDINKGNLKINMPVINQNGLIGFISKTSKNTSEVSLITNLNDKKLTVLINNNISGILTEYNKKNKMFKITDVISKEEIKKDDLVTLSGYDNELYKGIFLGYVYSIESDRYGLSKIIWVKTNTDFDNLMYVLVEDIK